MTRKRTRTRARERSEPATHGPPAERFGELVGAMYHGPIERIPWSTAIKLTRAQSRANWTSLVLRPASPGTPAQLIRDGGKGIELFTMGDVHYEMISLDGVAELTPGRVATIDETVNIDTWKNSRFYKSMDREQGSWRSAIGRGRCCAEVGNMHAVARSGSFFLLARNNELVLGRVT